MSLAWALKQKTIGREMMRDVLADLDSGLAKEKAIVAPKLPREPKQRVSQTSHPVAPIVESAPARGWWSKIGVTCLMFFSLGWLGIHLNVGKLIESSWHSLSAKSKGWVDQISAPSSPTRRPWLVLMVHRLAQSRIDSLRKRYENAAVITRSSDSPEAGSEIGTYNGILLGLA
jgi:hypothetical protein